MIRQDDISIKKTASRVPGMVTLRASLAYSDEVTAFPSTEDQSVREMKTRIWLTAYGEFAQAVYELEREVMPRLQFGGHGGVTEAFDKLKDMVRCPF